MMVALGGVDLAVGHVTAAAISLRHLYFRNSRMLSIDFFACFETCENQALHSFKR